jgi:hypothetical protein
MRLLPAILAVVLATPATVAGQAAASARPTIAVMKVTGDNAQRDSLSMSWALARGLQLDSLVEVVDRPIVDGRVSLVPGLQVRPATFVLTAVSSQVGSTHLVSLRVLNVETSESVVKASTRAATGVLSDSLAAMGRRVARTLVGAPPVASRP